MKWTDNELSVFYPLEHAIRTLHRRHPEMTDYMASRAYEAAHKLFRAELTNHPYEQPALEGLDEEAFRAVLEAGRRLALEGADGSNGLSAVGPVPPEFLIPSLKELARSVERHTKRGGRQGYLTFLAGYMP